MDLSEFYFNGNGMSFSTPANGDYLCECNKNTENPFYCKLIAWIAFFFYLFPIPYGNRRFFLLLLIEIQQK